MRTFTYARPATLAEAVATLEAHGPDARALAGGTDLIIRLRDGSVAPSVVVDLKRIAELRPGIREGDGWLSIGATTVMTDIAADPRVAREFRALAEAAAVVGSVQIRNRATLAGNICNASPAADTAPPLLVYGAAVVAEDLEECVVREDAEGTPAPVDRDLDGKRVAHVVHPSASRWIATRR